MKALLSFALFVFSSTGFSASTIALPDLVNTPEEYSMVCYDSASGRLGNCADAASGKPARIAWVSQDGAGDYDDPNQAMADIDSWCPDRDSSSPCLIRMAPGTWTMGATPIVLLSDVHLQGSGGTPVLGSSRTALTIIKGTATGESTGVIESRSGGSIRDLVVINESTGTYGSAVYVQGGSHFYISGVQARASDATYSYGLKIESTEAVQTVVTANHSQFNGGILGTAQYGRGVYLVSSSPTEEFATLECTYCELRGYGSTNGYSLFMASFSSGSTVVELNYSQASHLIRSIGDGSRQVLAQFSTLSGMDLNAGTIETCAFVRSGGTSYTSTCP